MPSSGRFHGFFRRVGHSAKDGSKPGDQAPTSPSPSASLVPPGDPPPQLTSSLDPFSVPFPQRPARSPQPNVLLQSTLSPGQLPLTPSLLAATSNQPVNAEPNLTMAAKKAGADALAGLKVAMRLLESSADVFPPVKSAVAGFLEVLDIFEASDRRAAQNRKDYAALASDLQRRVEEFQERPGEHTASEMSEALKAMEGALEEQKEHIQKQLYAGALQDMQGYQDNFENMARTLQELLRMRRNEELQKGDLCLDKLNAVSEAIYNSNLANVIGRRTRIPGTQEVILAGTRKWADNPKGPEVYWLSGMAGTGKTTLAYSFCIEMQLARRLGASFFCSRADADSRDVSRIVPTIARQLTRLLPAYREALIRQVDQNTGINTWDVETQFEKLIRDPLREVAASVPAGIIVTIDALDECDRHDGAQDILDVLLVHARGLPLKFFVTCRPEPGLFDVLQSQETHHRSVLHLHDIEASFVRADIKKYLETELAEASLPPEKLGMLAEQAGTLFIYAATAVRYIHPKGRQVTVHKHLDNLLSMGSKTGTNKHRGIDELYTAVLSFPFADDDLEAWEKENIRLVLDTAICAREPMSITTMAKLLELDDESDVGLALQHLRSVLHVSQGTSLVSTLHASFPDFMLDQGRSKGLWCNASIHNRRLALGCFSVMKCLLQFNVCKLESSFILDENIPNLAERTNNAIPPELFYACRYWGDHMTFPEAQNGDQSMLDDFLSNRLLFWMEVLNLRKYINIGAQILHQVHVWLQTSGGSSDLLGLARDSARFVMAFSVSSASRSTPHIYISALPFWPQTHPIRLRYWKHTRGLVNPEGQVEDSSCIDKWNTPSNVLCVAFLPQGTHIASGSVDHSVCVWDTHSSLLVAGPFKGHTDWVNSVAFSPDGSSVASGSSDRTIRVWDVRNEPLEAAPCKGHTGRVNSIAFSYDGNRIVSGSSDRTIRVWDASSRLPVTEPFEGHTESVNSVGFSPNGKFIVSGSSDCTVRIWDAHSRGLVAGPFEGHADSVNSVAFSPGGSRIVSGSSDCTIRVWDAGSGSLVAGPFEGHTGQVRSVAFSPDSSHIVSGSSDHTICAWDADSGSLVGGPFRGHTGRVYSAVFSPDNRYIVSGSGDNTIRIWDADSKLPIARPFEGHTGWVNSVALSRDGVRAVSGSSDRTIRVWNAQSGLLVAGPFKGHTDSVTSVAFSPNGTRIVSGSSDNTICVWDADSGLPVAGPLQGHTSIVYSVAFSPDCRYVVSGSGDRTICMWDADSGNLIAGPLEGHTDWVTSVAFSPNGTRIASGSSDKTIRVWDACSRLPISQPFEGHTSIIYSVAFSPNSTLIVSGSDDLTIRVWNAASGDLVAGPFNGHTDWVNSVAFSPDGNYVTSGSSDRTICVWDVHSESLVAGPFEGHTGQVCSVAFSPDGNHIVSGSSDRTMRTWDAFPIHVPDPTHMEKCVVDKNGMLITDKGELLLCIPPSICTEGVKTQYVFCTSDAGAFYIDHNMVLLGTHWIGCYQRQ